MTDRKLPEGFAEFTLRSPGDSAYQVQLYGRAGVELADFTMMGAEDSKTVCLQPGEYTGRIVDLVGRTVEESPIVLREGTDISGIALRFHPGQDIDETYRWNSTKGVGKAYRNASLVNENSLLNFAEERGFFDRLVVRTERWADEASRQSKLAESRYQATKRDLRRTGKMLRSAFTPNKSEVSDLAFDIAMSEDRTLGTRGGWSIPENVEVKTSVSPGGALTISVSPSRPDRPVSRLRLSVSVEGAPLVRIPVPLYRDGVAVTLEPVDGGKRADFAVEIEALDDRIQSLVTALSNLDSENASKLLELVVGSHGDAVVVLAQKKSDFWAATVAALLLVRCGKELGREHWLRNLAEWAPHISDASIAAAWSTAASDGDTRQMERRVISLLAKSSEIGAPNFMVGQRMGVELLDSLRSTAQDVEVRALAREHYNRWARRVQGRLTNTPYLIWEDLADNVRQGTLPAEPYGRIVNGTLGGEGFLMHETGKWWRR